MVLLENIFIRKVEPYFDSVGVYVKKDKFPGADMNIIDYCLARFPAFTKKYFEIVFSNGEIAVNAQIVNKDYTLKEGDVVSQVFHRHENDILDSRCDIIFEDEDLLVVNKPSSWPVYPISNYKFNTLLYILMKEHGFRDLRNVHRIDAATSGICILGRSFIFLFIIAQVSHSKGSMLCLR